MWRPWYQASLGATSSFLSALPADENIGNHRWRCRSHPDCRLALSTPDATGEVETLNTDNSSAFMSCCGKLFGAEDDASCRELCKHIHPHLPTDFTQPENRGWWNVCSVAGRSVDRYRRRANIHGCAETMLREAAGREAVRCAGEWMMPGATCAGQTAQAELFPPISILTFSLFMCLSSSQ